MSNFDHDRELPEMFDDMTGPHDLSLSSGSAKDSPADTTGGVAWTPPSFDAAGWIADRHPDLVPRLRAADPACADEFVDIVFQAYSLGRSESIGVIRSRFEKLAAMVRRGEPR